MFEDLQRALVEQATDETADNIRTHTRCLRGIRGVAPGNLARLVTEDWTRRERPVSLPEDAGALDTLFGTAWEDGLAAIAYTAVALPGDPAAAMKLGLDWARRTDDLLTADSLGWLVLGPAAGRLDRVEDLLTELGREPFPFVRRAAAAAALSFTPEEIESPAAACLRAQAGTRQVRSSDKLVGDVVGRIVTFFVRDSEPMVQKMLRRAVRVWAGADPAELIAWAPTVRGGLPRLLGAEVDRVRPAHARKRGRS